MAEGIYQPNYICRRIGCTDYRDSSDEYCKLKSCKYSGEQIKRFLQIDDVNTVLNFDQSQLEELARFGEIVKQQVSKE